MTGRIGLIFNGVWSHYAVATAPKYAEIYEMLYVDDLPRFDLGRFDALVIPFQSNHSALKRNRDSFDAFLAAGKKIALFADASAICTDATWADRPTNNYWWVEDPQDRKSVV